MITRNKIYWFFKMKILFLSSLAVGIFFLITFTGCGENKRYTEGFKAVEAKNWDDAIEKMKVCLTENEKHTKAKALMMYATGRRWAEKCELEQAQQYGRRYKEAGRSRATEELSRLIYSYFETEGMIKVNPNVFEKEERSQFVDRRKELQRILREQMRENGIRTDNWKEVENIVHEAATLVYGLKVDEDDRLDIMSKLAASILLTREGNIEAGKFLVQQAAGDKTYLGTFNLAGGGLVEPLREELKNKESLIYEGGIQVLMALDMRIRKAEFLSTHANIRRPQYQDFADNAKWIYPEIRRYFYPTTWSSFGQDTDTALLAGTNWISFDPQKGAGLVTLISHESESEYFITELYRWKVLEWQPSVFVKDGESNLLRTKEFPYAIKLNQSGTKIAIGFARKEVKTEYRIEQKYDYSRRGYFSESVPYQAEAVTYSWTVYNVTDRRLEFLKEHDNTEPFEEINKDLVVNTLINIGANAYQYRIRPQSMGGGAGSYIGYSIPTRLVEDDQARYTITVSLNDLRIVATSKIGNGSISVRVDSDGRAQDWQYSGDLQ